jgi:hypothetical protein
MRLYSLVIAKKKKFRLDWSGLSNPIQIRVVGILWVVLMLNFFYIQIVVTPAVIMVIVV